MATIDCRGLNCPEPVLRTKNALEQLPAGNLEVIVDNETARENVIRFAENRGKKAKWSKESGYFVVAVSGEDSPGQPVVNEQEDLSLSSGPEPPVLFISTDRLGAGSDELGAMLMRNFIYTLTKREELPAAIVFMNAGVRLSTTGSPVLEELADLEGRKVQILVCGTCLDFYGLKEEHRAGLVSNMYDISDLLFRAGRIISM